MAGEGIQSIWQRGTVPFVLWMAGLAALCAIGVYLIARIRGSVRETDPDPGQFMQNFRELHDRGELSDEEYRTIRAMLAEKMRQQFLREEESSSDEPTKSGQA